MILYDHPDLLRWAADRLKIKDFGPSTNIGVLLADGTIAGVAVFNEFHFPDIQISFVTSTPRWASRAAIRAIMRYPFLQLKCSRITAVTEAQNQPARAFLQRFGFREEGHHRKALPTGDAVTYGLLREECRWLEE